MKRTICSALFAAFLIPSAGFADEVVGKVVQVKGVDGAKADLEYQRGEKADKWFAGYLDMQGQLHDKFKTSASTVAALEFIIGGRVTINKDSEIEIVSERSVADAKTSVKRVILRKGGIWAKTGKLNGPLEIQTNGGVMGIKGTEFVIDSTPSGDTSVAVLEGAVEVRGTDGKVVGTAQPGDTYKVYRDVKTHQPEKSHSDPDQLRRTLFDSDVWKGVSFLAGFMGGPISSAVGQAGYYGSVGVTAVTVIKDPGKAAEDYGKNWAQSHSPVHLPFGGGGNSKPPDPNFPVELKPDKESTGSAPTLQWKGFKEANGYIVMISSDSKFNNLEWTGRVEGDKDGKAAYPSNAAPLKAGPHWWKVIAVDSEDKPLKGKEASEASFEVK